MRKRNKKNIKNFYKILCKMSVKKYKIIYFKINKSKYLNNIFIIRKFIRHYKMFFIKYLI